MLRLRGKFFYNIVRLAKLGTTNWWKFSRGKSQVGHHRNPIERKATNHPRNDQERDAFSTTPHPALNHRMLMKPDSIEG